MLYGGNEHKVVSLGAVATAFVESTMKNTVSSAVAVLLQAKDLDSTASLDWTALGIGASAAAVTGYVALKLLLKLVNTGDFSKFAWYCWAMALVALGVWVSELEAEVLSAATEYQARSYAPVSTP